MKNTQSITGALILNVRNKTTLLNDLNKFFGTDELIIHSGKGLDINLPIEKYHLKAGSILLKSNNYSAITYSSRNVSIYGWLDGKINSDSETANNYLQKEFIASQKDFDPDLNFKSNLYKNYFSKLEGNFLAQLGYLSYNTRPCVILMNNNMCSHSIAYSFKVSSDYDALFWTDHNDIYFRTEVMLPSNSLMLLQPTFLVNKWKNWVEEDLSENLQFSTNKFLNYLKNMTMLGD